MEIKYLRYFQSLLGFYNRNESNNKFHATGLSLAQIELLEHHFFSNSNEQFPIVLRELLFLCGAYCPYVDVGCYLPDKQSLTTEGLLQKQQSNPYFLYRDKHDWPVFFDQKDIWTLASVYESSDCFWFIDLRTKSKNPQLYFFDTEALYEGNEKPISNDIDKENTSELLLSHIIVTEFLEYASEKEKMYSIAYKALYNENHSQEVLQEHFCELIHYKDLEGLRYFLKKGAQIAYNDFEALWLAAKVNFREGIALFFDSLEAKETLVDRIFLTGVRKNSLAIIWHLLAEEKLSQKGKDSALVMAVAMCNNDLVDSLLHKGAEVNANNSLAICLGLRNQQKEIIETLAYQDNFKQLNGGFALLYKEMLEKHNLMWIFANTELKETPVVLIEAHEQQVKEVFGKHYEASLFQAIEVH